LAGNLVDLRIEYTYYFEKVLRKSNREERYWRGL